MHAGDFFSLFGALLGFILILVLAYWAVRLLSRGYGAQGAGRSIQVVDRVGLGTDKQLLIVKAAGRAFLLGVTAQRIEKLEELDPDALTLPPEGAQEKTFMEVLKNALDRKK